MAKLFDAEQRIVPTWRAAARHLLSRRQRGYTDRNLILEIPDPITVTAAERTVLQDVDALIRAEDDALSIETVAGTIFPAGLYQRYGRPEFYRRFTDIMARAKKPGTWGTYAMRLIARSKGNVTINPLDIIVEKLRHASTEGHGYRAAYEAGFIDPVTDLHDPSLEFGCELPTYDPGVDARKISNMPCLSHLSFKLTEGTHVDLTAIYRSHYYCQRALGNLIGLSRLHSFVAKEAELAVGALTCVSTHAVLDVDSWGGIGRTSALLERALD